MGAITRHALAIGLLGALGAGAAACSRTDDGSVVVPRPLDMRRMWQRDLPEPSTGIVSEDPAFPVAPIEARNRPAGRYDPVVGRRPARRKVAGHQDMSVPQSGLACHQPDNADGRVKVRCD